MRQSITKNDIKLLSKIGERVRLLRKEAGLSQYNLGTDANNMSKNQIGRIERGEINTTITNLNNIAKALKVNLRDLVDPIDETKK